MLKHRSASGDRYLLDEAEALSNEVASFIERFRSEADCIEVWAQRERQSGFLLGPVTPLEQTRFGIGVRVWQGDRLGTAAVDSTQPADWEAGLRAAIEAAQPSPIPPPPAPSARRPEPSVLDPALPEALATQNLLPRLAHALEENARHEAERIPGLERISGHVLFISRQRVVGNSGGVVSEQLGELNCEVELDGRHGEQVRLIHLADSFLPFALMGARAWRTMPRTVAEAPGDAAPRSVAVILHPRVLEGLLRPGLAQLMAEPEVDQPPHFHEGELIMDPAITLVDDPGLDGLVGSRAFDDEGQPTRRSALVIRGRMTQHLRGRQSAQRTGRPATGSMVRHARGDRGPQHTQPEPALSCVLMERGQPQFHDLVAEARELVVIHALEADLIVDPATTAFSATIRWGTLLEEGTAPRVLAPKRWRVRGHLLAIGADSGLLHGLTPCRDVLDTGTGILPYCRGTLTLEVAG